MIKVIVVGACGRMGSTLTRLIYSSWDIKLAGATEAPGHPNLGRDVGDVNGLGSVGIPIVYDLAKIIDQGDVIVDFTSPVATLKNLELAVLSHKAMVIGTTGFSIEQIDRLQALAAQIPCVMSPNMSLGVNLLFKLVQEVATILGEGYDVEIIETHHRMKKDAPSGTAKRIAEIVAETLGWDLESAAVHGREGIVGERKRQEIGIHSVRAGDIVGDHQVIFSNVGERIELIHRAHSRETFAQGALPAIRYVVKAPNGLHDMRDVLNPVT